MNLGPLDLVLWAAAATLIVVFLRIAYEQGVDAGWQQAGRWLDEHFTHQHPADKVHADALPDHPRQPPYDVL